LYDERLASIGDLILPVMAEGCTSNYHLYVIRTKKRNDLQQFLSENGIGTVIHYPVPPHMQQAYKEYNFSASDFPLASIIAETCLSLPIYPGMTIDQLSYICTTIKRFYA
jgi:dTDP-4-amino-4,6-dideoxygalactose transaminase